MILGILLLGVLFISACESGTKEMQQGSQAAVGRARGSPEKNGGSEDTQYPSVSSTVSPSNPGLNQPFTLTISATDDTGVKSLAWKSSKAFSNSGQSDSFDCNSQKTCTHSWDFVAAEEGLHQFTISVDDISGKIMDNINAQADVGPARAATSTSTTSSGTSTDNSNTGPSPFFTCGNNVCEGGESYESCSDDCTPQDIGGTNPANGACEPGEDLNNAPKDCTIINKQCGNGACDSGEDRLNCYYDCKNGGSSSDSGSASSCSTNSDCGSKQRCKSGKCVTVECTSDYNCKGCARCSDNRCVSCGYGTAGYCTC